MSRMRALLTAPAVIGGVALTPLVYFAAEWVVSASWRGHYGYREDPVGRLGIAFCGPEGNWPCSALYPAMNAALVLTGLAVAFVAAGLSAQGVTQRGHALLLAVAGTALAASGLVTENVDYSWNRTLMTAFLVLGSVAVVFIAMESRSPLSGERRGVAVAAGAIALAGYLASIGHGDVLGVGMGQRMALYGILIAVIALGTVGLRRPTNRSCHLAVVAVALAVCGCALPPVPGHADPGRVEPSADTEQKIVFFDDFDGPAGTSPAAHWRFDTGGGGWGNNELQVYTDSPANASLDGAGRLAITARAEADQRITSARLTTRGTFDFTYGRAEARIALPAGTGLHPAFWLLGSDIDRVGWPWSGEIDVIETLNHAGVYHMGVHAPKAGSKRGQEVSASGPAPGALAGVFRTYWVQRTPGHITMGVDDLQLFSVTPVDLAAETDWVFDAPFFLLLNLAVGGNWPGPPDHTTPNPSVMLVDWVKVTEL